MPKKIDIDAKIYEDICLELGRGTKNACGASLWSDITDKTWDIVWELNIPTHDVCLMSLNRVFEGESKSR